MRRALLVFAAILAASCARRPPAPEPRTDLEGFWVGGAVAEFPGRATLNVAGNRFHFQGPTRSEWWEGGFERGPDARFRKIDLTIEKAEEDRGRKIHALYRIDGDVLTVALTRPGAPGPPESLEPGRGVLVVRFRRAPVDPRTATSPASR